MTAKIPTREDAFLLFKKFNKTTVLARPSKSVLDSKVKSIKKKLKDKRFTAGVDRSIIVKGAEILGLGISDLIDLTIEGMKTAAEEIGLRGEIQ